MSTPTVRSRRITVAVSVWALVYAGAGLVAIATGIALDVPGLPSWLPGWIGLAIGILVLPLCALNALEQHGSAGQQPSTQRRKWVRPALVIVAAPLVASGFGLLMETTALLFGAAPDSWPNFGYHLLSTAGAVLIAAMIIIDRPPLRMAGVDPQRNARRAQVAALVGTAGLLPYLGMKQAWAFGLTFAGIAGDQVLEASARNGASRTWLFLESIGLDPTALLALVGIFLIWGLARPWGLVFPRWTLWLRGRRVPRWLPLTPAVIGVTTLVPYGVLGLGYLGLVAAGVLQIRRGDGPTAQSTLEVATVGMVAFATYGVALAVAALSYWRRTGNRYPRGAKAAAEYQP